MSADYPVIQKCNSSTIFEFFHSFLTIIKCQEQEKLKRKGVPMASWISAQRKGKKLRHDWRRQEQQGKKMPEKKDFSSGKHLTLNNQNNEQ